MLSSGLRIVRGPDWSWNNQDGGEGFVGTAVCEKSADTPDKTAFVQWDNGNSTIYRVGYMNKYDLRVIDNAQIGAEHPNIVCDGCKSQGICGMKYVCSLCCDHELCFMCYHGDKHDLAHPFKRFDSATVFGVGLPARQSGRKCELKGIFKGAKVVRAYTWKWGNQVEGDGKIGEVVDIDNESSHSVANVMWTSGSRQVYRYRLGHKGDCDIKFVEPASGGPYYPEHLPILGQYVEQAVPRPQRTGPPRFNVGDKNKQVMASEKQLKAMQQDHSGHTPKMTEIGGNTWTSNPQCIRIVPGSANKFNNTMQATQNQRQEPSMEWHPANPADNQTNGVADQLVRAAAQGQHETVQRLLESVPRNLVDMRSGGKTALQVAAHQGYVNIVKLLLQTSACVNASDNDGDTCLHYAAFGNQPEVLDLLVKAGSNLNTANRNGCTALHIAAHKQPAKCVQILLSAGANPNCMDLCGNTALHDAIGKDSYQVIELLSEANGIDFTSRNERGYNVLHHAALLGDNFATRKLLLQARQLVDVKKDDGFSALHLAALNGHKDVVETLVTIGQADINLRNNRKQTALLLAVSQGHSGVIENLIKLKANINAKDENDYTALHLVLIKKSLLKGEIRQEDSPEIYQIYETISQINEHKLAIAIACYLIKSGIDLDSQNSKGQTALSLLQESHLQELLKSYKPVENNQRRNFENFTQQRAHIERYNLANSPVRNSEGTKNTSRSRINETEETDNSSSQENSSKRRKYHNKIGTTNSKLVECLICSDLSEENVRLEPCTHKPACEDCSSRMKKCLQCGSLVQKRITKDGRVISTRSRQPSAERICYLECEIAKIEESHACLLCMKRERNVTFQCGHGTCSICADPLKTCHMCHRPITKKIPIY